MIGAIAFGMVVAGLYIGVIFILCPAIERLEEEVKQIKSDRNSSD
jgi:hypothetical protein